MMKQYEKIFVLHDPKIHVTFFDDNYHVYHEGLYGITEPPIEVVPMKDVVVLDMGEMMELWKAAADWSDQKEGNLDFNAYMRLKGIFSGITKF